jgi:hypothetical protein
MIPTDTKRSYTYLIGLDGTGLLIAGAGLFATIGVFHEPWSLWLRIPAMILVLASTAALAWGKWPPGEHGDKVDAWLHRFWHYYQDEHVKLPYQTAHRHMTPPKSADKAPPHRWRKSRR